MCRLPTVSSAVKGFFWQVVVELVVDDNEEDEDGVTAQLAMDEGSGLSLGLVDKNCRLYCFAM